MGAIANGLSMLISKLVAAVTWFGELFVAVFVAFWDIFRDVPCWCLDQIMELVTGAVGAVDVSGMQGYASYWSGLASEIVNIMGLVGMGTAFSIIGGAIAIRLTLQLIPFVRLGS